MPSNDITEFFEGESSERIVWHFHKEQSFIGNAFYFARKVCSRYAVAVFLVVTLVTAVFGLLSSTGDKNIENQSKSGIQCWNEIKK